MTVKKLVEQARQAMEEIANYSQEQVDAMVEAVGKAVFLHAEELAEMAVEETGIGRVDHKIGKNSGIPTNVYKETYGKKSVGVIEEDEALQLVKVGHPVGVVGSVTPSTNPTITPTANGMMALKGRNAMVVSPHPGAQKTTKRTIDLMREALESVGAPANLLQYIDEPSIEKSQELMSSVDVIVATGGPGLVHSAYSSGVPAYGVGPGNAQAILDEDYDVDTAAQLSVIGRSFDNGIVCACQQSLFFPRDKQEEVISALEKHGACVYQEEDQVNTLRETMFVDGTADRQFIGKDPVIIAKAAGLDCPEDAQILAVLVDKNGEDELFAMEKLNPTLMLRPYDDFEEAVALAKENLVMEGGGHTAAIFTNNDDHARQVAIALPVGRVMVNQPTIDSGGSATNGLWTTASLGCGTWGNNIISENLNYKHLLNISQIAKPIENKTNVEVNWG